MNYLIYHSISLQLFQGSGIISLKLDLQVLFISLENIL